MGNNVSSPPTLPLTFDYCFNEGQVDINKFQMHLFVKRKREENLHQPLYVPASCPNDIPAAKKQKNSLMQKNRIDHQRTLWYNICNKANKSLWYMMYVQTQPTTNYQKNFFCK